MQFPRFRIQFTLSENSIKILDISLFGMAILSFYGLYKCVSKKKEEKQKLKRFQYLYTVDECQQLKIDSKQITVQGQINSSNQFILFESSHHEGKINNLQKRIKNRESFLIVDPYTKSEIDGKINKDCLFDENLFNYRKRWTYQTFVSSQGNFIVRQYKKIINYFFGKTLIENIEGIDINQYFVFQGILKKQDSKLILEIDNMVKNPNLIYYQIKKNIEKYQIREWILLMISTSLIYYFYKKIKEMLQLKVVQPRLFQKTVDDVVDDSDLCITCMTNVRNILILPCFHLICCQECLNQIQQAHNQCPLCRTQITQQKQVLIDNIY